jgi:putative addiction module component (TIGR02574 family)
MATETLRRLRSEALMLPEAERAELAHELVKSLDAPADADVADAWDKEILRRLAEIDAGTAKLIDRGEFKRRMRARLRRTYMYLKDEPQFPFGHCLSYIRFEYSDLETSAETLLADEPIDVGVSVRTSANAPATTSCSSS